MHRVIKCAIIVAMIVSMLAVSPAAATPTPTTTVSRNGDPCVPNDKPCWVEHMRKRANEAIYWAEVVKQQKARAEAARIARIYAFAHAVEQQRLASAYAAEIGNGGRLVQGISVCGSWFPCHIVARESGFNPTARNPNSTAGGLYQFLRFWLQYCGLSGYSNFSQVPVIDQVRCAKKVVRQHGLSPWRLTR